MYANADPFARVVSVWRRNQLDTNVMSISSKIPIIWEEFVLPNQRTRVRHIRPVDYTEKRRFKIFLTQFRDRETVCYFC